MTTINTTPVTAITRDDPARGWAIAAHVLGMLFGCLGPLFALLVAGRRTEFARQHARQGFNFQMTLGVALLAAGLAGTASDALLPAAGALIVIADVALAVLAAARAGRGEWQPYPPVIIPFLRSLPEPALH